MLHWGGQRPIVTQTLDQAPSGINSNLFNKLRLRGFQRGPEGFVRYDGVTKNPDGTLRYVKDKEGKLVRERLILLAAGGVGSAKSFGGAIRLVRYIAENPGAHLVVGAPTFPMLERATQPAIFTAFRNAGWESNVHYDYIKNRETITFWNECIVWFATTEHPERLAGPTLAAVWLDESKDSPEVAFTNLLERVRQPGYPLQFWMTTTPKGRLHYLYKHFFRSDYAHLVDQGDVPLLDSPDEYKVYTALTKENIDPELGEFLGQELHNSMVVVYGGEDTPLARQQLYGEFILAEGLVFDTWNRETFVKPRDQWPAIMRTPPDLVLAGVDFGFRAPHAVLTIGYWEEGPYIALLDEFVKARMPNDDLALVCKQLQKQHDIRVFFCDHDPERIRALRQRGLRAVRANKHIGTPAIISSGLGACALALNSKTKDGEQAFYVLPHLGHFISQIEAYVEEDETNIKREASEIPRNFHMDTIAAWRYGMTGLAKLRPPDAIRQLRRARVLDTTVPRETVYA